MVANDEVPARCQAVADGLEEKFVAALGLRLFDVVPDDGMHGQ